MGRLLLTPGQSRIRSRSASLLAVDGNRFPRASVSRSAQSHADLLSVCIRAECGGLRTGAPLQHQSLPAAGSPVRRHEAHSGTGWQDKSAALGRSGGAAPRRPRLTLPVPRDRQAAPAETSPARMREDG